MSRMFWRENPTLLHNTPLVSSVLVQTGGARVMPVSTQLKNLWLQMVYSSRAKDANLVFVCTVHLLATAVIAQCTPVWL